MIRVLRRWRVCRYKKRKRAHEHQGIQHASPRGSIYMKALEDISNDYPSIKRDPVLWDGICRVSHYVQCEHQGNDKKLSLDSPSNVATSQSSLSLYLQRLYHLGAYEFEFFIACLLPQLSTKLAKVYQELANETDSTATNVELVERILSHSPNEPVLMSADSRLFKHRMLSWLKAEDGPPSCETGIVVSDPVIEFLLARYRPDPRLDNILEEPKSLRGFDELSVDPKLQETLQELASFADVPSRGSVFYFYGPPGTPRRMAAEAMTRQLGRRLFVVDVEAALRSDEAWKTVTELCLLAARSAGAVLYWSHFDLLLHDGHREKFEHLVSLLQDHPGTSFLESVRQWEPLGQFYETAFLRVEFPLPSFSLQVDTWNRMLHESSHLDPQIRPKELAEELASGFQLTTGGISDAINSATRLAVLRSPQCPRVQRDDLREGCRLQAGRRLQNLAKHVAPRPRDRSKQPFADLVLPSANKRRLLELSQRIHLRGGVASHFGREGLVGFDAGIVGLFTGPSGTGKTMAVELLAGEHRKDLYKIDMSSLVSKFVGETEENLNKVFTEAEGSNSILFFDECESLFARRGEIRDPRDRWANMETNYLLQRIEEFRGVVIMATNLRQNIDDAFQRRIHVSVDFPFPNPEARLQILEILLPPRTEFDRPRREELAAFTKQFQVSGGFIRNVVIDAAFRALGDHDQSARAKPNLTLQHLVIALGREYEKLGRSINQTEFGSLFFGWYQEYANPEQSEPRLASI